MPKPNANNELLFILFASLIFNTISNISTSKNIFSIMEIIITYINIKQKTTNTAGFYFLNFPNKNRILCSGDKLLSLRKACTIALRGLNF